MKFIRIITKLIILINFMLMPLTSANDLTIRFLPFGVSMGFSFEDKNLVGHLIYDYSYLELYGTGVSFWTHPYECKSYFEDVYTGTLILDTSQMKILNSHINDKFKKKGADYEYNYFEPTTTPHSFLIAPTVEKNRELPPDEYRLKEIHFTSIDLTKELQETRSANSKNTRKLISEPPKISKTSELGTVPLRKLPPTPSRKLPSTPPRKLPIPPKFHNPGNVKFSVYLKEKKMVVLKNQPFSYVGNGGKINTGKDIESKTMMLAVFDYYLRVMKNMSVEDIKKLISAGELQWVDLSNQVIELDWEQADEKMLAEKICKQKEKKSIKLGEYFYVMPNIIAHLCNNVRRLLKRTH
jgi:hypothetical protein